MKTDKFEKFTAVIMLTSLSFFLIWAVFAIYNSSRIRHAFYNLFCLIWN